MRWKGMLLALTVVTAVGIVICAVDAQELLRRRAELATAVAPAKILRHAPEPAGASPELARRLQEKMNVSFEETNLVSVLEFIAGEAGVNVAYAPELALEPQERLVTLKAEEASVESVLRTVARMRGLKAQLIGDIVYLEGDPQRRLEHERHMGRPIGSLEIKLSEDPPAALKLELTAGDLPPEMRGHLVRRLLREAGLFGEEGEGATPRQ